MVASGLVAVLSVLLLFPHASIAATLHEDVTDGARLVRRETQQMEMTPHGQMHHDHPHSHHHGHHQGHHQGHRQGHRQSHHHEHHDKVQHDKPHVLLETKAKPSRDVEELGDTYCDFDFVLGEEGTHHCTDQTLHTPVADWEMCMHAGGLSGAKTDHSTFKVPQANWQEHPKGCFKFTCGKYVTNPPANNVCYFYNDIEAIDKNATVTGTPICSRARWLNGTKDSADADGGCPTGYQVVVDEDTCHEAGKCERASADPYFRVGIKNASLHLDHPLGCFFDNVLDEVFYNAASSVGTPTAPVQGTPICNVSETVQWPAL